jgi:hypothetical protein
MSAALMTLLCLILITRSPALKARDCRSWAFEGSGSTAKTLEGQDAHDDDDDDDDDNQ